MEIWILSSNFNTWKKRNNGGSITAVYQVRVRFVQRDQGLYSFVGENWTELNLSALGAARPQLGAARSHSSAFSNRHDFARSRIPLEHWERSVLTWERPVSTRDGPPSLAATRRQLSEFHPMHITGYTGDGPPPIGDGPLPTWYIYTLYINQILSLIPFYYFIIKVIF